MNLEDMQHGKRYRVVFEGTWDSTDETLVMGIGKHGLMDAILVDAELKIATHIEEI